jgi:hypothetical protein
MNEPETGTYVLKTTPNTSRPSCSVCNAEFILWQEHSCSPHLMKRIEALEAIVNKFICDGK